ncbi:MAG: Gfo/Idh/MocA family oxidoreductase, partial [Gemmatimonadetes bacterium]|nr:Gfo/Idh/MocA family oxidoreductase [Gemmatimonadota bacterium]
MISSRPIKWGILSTARIGGTAFIPSARATPDAQVHAVASRSQATAEAFAQAHDIPVALGSYQALLDHPDIDAIYISLPNLLHAEWTIKAAEASKHIFCEKPLAVTAAEGRQMVEACRKADVLLFEAFVFMHHPQSRRLREIIAAGEIGTLRHINAGMTYV